MDLKKLQSQSGLSELKVKELMVYEGFISDLCKETQLQENKVKIDFNEVL